MQYRTHGSNALAAPYIPSYHDIQQQKRRRAEYIQPPERQTQTATQKAIRVISHTAKQASASISTRTLHTAAAGLLLATAWMNVALAYLTLLLIPVLAFTITDINSLWVYTYCVPVVLSIAILIYQYSRILVRKFDRVNCLRKRNSIIKALKQTAYISLRTQVFIFGVFIPAIAKIALQVLGK